MKRIFSLNLLEFIAAKITIYITLKVLQVENKEYGIKIKCFTDISRSIGWMHHSTFNLIRDKAHDEVESIISRDNM